MKYIVEFRVKPGHIDKMLETFEKKGPNRNAGVAFRSAWVGTRGDVVFALVESDDESRVAEVAATWSEHADTTQHPVREIEQF